jgi:uncharacterized membrane protein YphA (DoxX/SURF4 family)
MNDTTKSLATVLKLAYSIIPIVAGLDKFTNILTDWGQYMGPGMASMLPFEVSTFMMIVGIIEIVAGILVYIQPKIGAYVVMAWLVGIALSLLFSWHFVDVAVRDLMMALGAYALAKLSEENEMVVAA